MRLVLRLRRSADPAFTATAEALHHEASIINLAVAAAVATAVATAAAAGTDLGNEECGFGVDGLAAPGLQQMQ